MLIPIGFFGGGGAAAGAYELISSSILASNSTVTFSSIPQTYKHLQIRWTARSSAAQGQMTMRFNGITDAKYEVHRLAGNGTTVASSQPVSGQTNFQMYYTAAQSGAQTGVWGSGIIDILDYTATTKVKIFRMLSGVISTSDTGIALHSGGCFDSTLTAAGVDSIYLASGASTNWATGSRFSLYGIKG